MDSVHSMDRIFVLFDPRRRYGQVVTDISLLDVTPTILELMEIPVPGTMGGRPIAAVGK
jgi:predicted AlkP superfamily phosphohydrolase/phosphomutase